MQHVLVQHFLHLAQRAVAEALGQHAADGVQRIAVKLSATLTMESRTMPPVRHDDHQRSRARDGQHAGCGCASPACRGIITTDA